MGIGRVLGGDEILFMHVPYLLAMAAVVVLLYLIASSLWADRIVGLAAGLAALSLRPDW